MSDGDTLNELRPLSFSIIAVTCPSQTISSDLLKMASFVKIFNSSVNLLSRQLTIPATNGINLQFIRALPHFVDIPKPGKIFVIFCFGQLYSITFTGEKHRQYRRIVHYPEDGKYTVKPLDNTHLAGRDPVTGRVVAKGIGGGIKFK